MLQEDLFVGDSPPVCLVQLSNKSHNLASPETFCSKVALSESVLPEVDRALGPSTCSAVPVLNIAGCPVSPAAGESLARLGSKLTGAYPKPEYTPISTGDCNGLVPANTISHEMSSLALSTIQDNRMKVDSINEVNGLGESCLEDMDEDLDPEDRPLRVDLTKDFEVNSNTIESISVVANKTATITSDEPLVNTQTAAHADSRSSLSTPLTVQPEPISCSKTVPEKAEAPANTCIQDQPKQQAAAERAEKIGSTDHSSPPMMEEEGCGSIPKPFSPVTTDCFTVPTSLPLASTPDAVAASTAATTTTIFTTGLLDIRPKPVISHTNSFTANTSTASPATSCVSTYHLTSQSNMPAAMMSHYVANPSAVMPNAPPIPFGSLSATNTGLPLAGSASSPAGGGTTGGLQILNMTPIPQFLGTPGIVLHSAGAPSFHSASTPLIPGMPAAPLGPGPPLNFLQSSHPGFPPTLIQPSGMDFLMDPTLGLTHHPHPHQYAPSTQLGSLMSPLPPGQASVLDPLASIYHPSFVHAQPPPPPPNAFLVTSSSVFIPSSYRSSVAGGTNIVNATAPQMCTSLSHTTTSTGGGGGGGGSFFSCSSLPSSVASVVGGGPLYLHPTHTPILPSSFGPTPTSLYAQYPSFSVSTWQGGLDPCISMAPNFGLTSYPTLRPAEDLTPTPTTVQSSSTVVPMCFNPTIQPPVLQQPPPPPPVDSVANTLPQPPALQPCPLISRKFPLPIARAPPSVTPAPKTVAHQTVVRPTLLTSTMAGLVPNQFQSADYKSPRTVGIRAPNSSTVLPPLRRRRPPPTTQPKSKPQPQLGQPPALSDSPHVPTSALIELPEVRPVSTGPQNVSPRSSPADGLLPGTMPALSDCCVPVSQPICATGGGGSVVPSSPSSGVTPIGCTKLASPSAGQTVTAADREGNNDASVACQPDRVPNGLPETVASPTTKPVPKACRSPSSNSLSSSCRLSTNSPVAPSNLAPATPTAPSLSNGFKEHEEHSSHRAHHSDAPRVPSNSHHKERDASAAAVAAASPLEAIGLFPVGKRTPGTPLSVSHPLPPPVLLGPDSHRILTHYVDGHVIYESNKPFPVRNGMSVVEAALLQQCIKEDRQSQQSPPNNPLSTPVNPWLNGFERGHSTPGANDIPPTTTVADARRSPGRPPSYGSHAAAALFSTDLPFENFNPTEQKTADPLACAKPIAERLSTAAVLSRTTKPFAVTPSGLSFSSVDSDSADSTGKDDDPTLRCVRVGESAGLRQARQPSVSSPMSSSPSNAVSFQSSTAVPTSTLGFSLGPPAPAPPPPPPGACQHPALPLPAPPGPVSKWTSEDVVDFVRGTPGCAAYAAAFLANEIDGEALLLLAQDQFIQPPIGMKIGPALKLAARLESIRHAV